MTNRIHIDAPTGVIEVEGEKDFVEAQLDKLLPLIESCGFGTIPSVSQAPADDANASGDAAPQVVEDTNGPAGDDKPKKSRRGKVRAPKGQGCADRIKVLRDDGFFKEHKTVSEIVTGLAEKGWTHKSNQVSAAAGKMFDRNVLQRTKAGKGFAYYWDRD